MRRSSLFFILGATSSVLAYTLPSALEDGIYEAFINEDGDEVHRSLDGSGFRALNPIAYTPNKTERQEPTPVWHGIVTITDGGHGL